MRTIHKHIFSFLLLIIFFLCSVNRSTAQSRYGQHDTILTVAVVYEGDTIEAKILPGIYVWTKSNLTARARWTRLRNAVYVTYPYAKKAGIVFTDIEKHIVGNPDKQFITKYINSREKELKGGFTARFWQTVAFFFGSDLKQPYDAKGQDADIEIIVKEVQRMYGYSG